MQSIKSNFYLALLLTNVLISSALILGSINRPALSNQLVFPELKNDSNYLRVVSYNIRGDLPIDRSNGNSWDVRKYQIQTLLNHYQPDIIGLQEVSTSYLPDITTLFSEYNYIAFKSCPLFYDAILLVHKHRFRIEAQKYFWISPGLMHKNPHLATYAILNDLKTSQNYAVFCTHFDSGDTAGIELRINNANILTTKQKEIANNLPVIILGDFNFITDNQSLLLKSQITYKILTQDTGLTDIRDLCQNYYGPDGSWIGWRYDQFAAPLNTVGSRLDHIFTKGFLVNNAGILDIKVNNNNLITRTHHDFSRLDYPSDHLPVIADINSNQ